MKCWYRALEAIKERLIETSKDCVVTVTAMRKVLGKDVSCCFSNYFEQFLPNYFEQNLRKIRLAKGVNSIL